MSATRFGNDPNMHRTFQFSHIFPPFSLQRTPPRKDVSTSFLLTEMLVELENSPETNPFKAATVVCQRHDAESSRRALYRMYLNRKKAAGQENASPSALLQSMKSHGNDRLTLSQETLLVLCFKRQGDLGNSIGVENAPAFANVFLGLSAADGLDRFWAQRFFERYKDSLSVSKEKSMVSRRRDTDGRPNVAHFVNVFPNEFMKVNRKARRLFNADETLINYKRGNKGTMAFIRAKGSTAVRGHIPMGSMGSFLPFVSADGTLLTALYIFNTGTAKTTEIDVPVINRGNRANNSALNTHFLGTATGYVDGPAFRRGIELFIGDLQRHGMTGLDILVACDNLRTHLDPETLAYAAKHCVHFIFLPPNTSHVTQPLDRQPFANFKRALEKENMMTAEMLSLGDGNTREHRKILAGNLESAIVQGFSKEAIKASFRDTGLYPVNMQLLSENVDKNINEAKPMVSQESRRNSIVEMVGNVFNNKAKAVDKARDKVKKRTERKSIATKYTSQSTSRDIIGMEKRAASQKTKKQLKKRLARHERDKGRCRGRHPNKSVNPVYNQDKESKQPEAEHWQWCEICDEFGFCAKCYSEQEHQTSMATHEASCRAKLSEELKSQISDMGSEDEGGDDTIAGGGNETESMEE